MIRRTLALLLVLAALAGCKDQRESITGPNQAVLDADGVFQTVFVSTQVFTFQNALVQRCLEIIERGEITPVFGSSCGGGSGRIIISVDDPLTPWKFRIAFETFRINCQALLPMTLSGEMSLEFDEISPGLRYRITMPFNQNTQQPEGALYQLSQDFGNAILATTTPGQIIFSNNVPIGIEQPYLSCELIDGEVHQIGTMRIENRAQGFLFVENLDIRYAYDAQSLERFAPWPAGIYELAAHQGISDPPKDIVLDGFGGATFEYFGRSCITDLTVPPRDGNPCSGL